MTESPQTGLVVLAQNLTKIYRRGQEEIRALDGVDLRIDSGEFVAIVGPSGAGKSTLLQLIGAMDTPTSGELIVAGQNLAKLSDSALTALRRNRIGFVFQHFSLLPTLTVAENVALPGSFGRNVAAGFVETLLEKVGLTHRRDHRPHELSGGEMQRAAIARALVNKPALLLADEPTGNLDSATSERILSLLRDLRKGGLTVIVVTHSESLAASADRQIALLDGQIAS